MNKRKYNLNAEQSLMNALYVPDSRIQGKNNLCHGLYILKLKYGLKDRY